MAAPALKVPSARLEYLISRRPKPDRPARRDASFLPAEKALFTFARVPTGPPLGRVVRERFKESAFAGAAYFLQGRTFFRHADPAVTSCIIQCFYCSDRLAVHFAIFRPLHAPL